jgi:hypothetical protein
MKYVLFNGKVVQSGILGIIYVSRELISYNRFKGADYHSRQIP